MLSTERCDALIVRSFLDSCWSQRNAPDCGRQALGIVLTLQSPNAILRQHFFRERAKMGLSTPEQGEAGSAPRGLQTRLAVLIFTDIVGSTDLKNKLGMAGYSQVLARHNELFEVALTDFTGAKIIK